MRAFLVLSVAIFLASGCGSVQRKAVDVTANILSDASYEMETESNWENFRQAVPANLKMIEGLLYVNKKNEKLLATLTKGYAAYSFVVYDTLFLDSLYSEKDDIKYREQAISHNNRAMQYGLRYLKSFGFDYREYMTLQTEDGAQEAYLNDKLDDSEMTYETLYFLSLAFMNSINHQKSNMKMVAQLPVAKSMMDWVCKRRPDINFGNCQIMNAAYESSRPRSLGGNPQNGKKLFKAFIKKNPNFWFARVSYLQFYVVPMMDEDEYKREKVYLERAVKKHRELLKWSPAQKVDETENKNMRIYQALAIKRYEIIKKYEKELF